MSEEKKEESTRFFTVTFVPNDCLSYEYYVEAVDEAGAYDVAQEELQWAIGRDAAKDWNASGCVEDTDEN